MTVAVRSDRRPEFLIPSMGQAIAALDPNLAVQHLDTVDQAIARATGGLSMIKTVLICFAGLGLFLAALGLYGVIARLVVQRTPEIGIRMALGAQVRDVTWLILGSGLRLISYGAGIGIVGSTGLYLVEVPCCRRSKNEVAPGRLWPNQPSGNTPRSLRYLISTVSSRSRRKGWLSPSSSMSVLFKNSNTLRGSRGLCGQLFGVTIRNHDHRKAVLCRAATFQIDVAVVRLFHVDQGSDVVNAGRIQFLNQTGKERVMQRRQPTEFTVAGSRSPQNAIEFLDHTALPFSASRRRSSSLSRNQRPFSCDFRISFSVLR